MNLYKDTYDPALLQRPIKDRLDFFKSKHVNHAIQNNAFDRAVASLRSAAGPKVMVITGPTGVGKTTLGRGLFRRVQRMHAEEAHIDKSIIPIIGVNAAPPIGTSFNWRDFYARILQGNKDILLDQKISLTGQSEMFANASHKAIEGSDADTLRRSLESSIAHRKTRYLFIDEAHHILMVKDPNRLEFQFEMLKSLTIESDVTIVLMGTYDLLDIRDYSGQLVRRSEILHMGRYDSRDQHHRQQFISALQSLLSLMPLKIRPDLSKDTDYFFTKSAGCIGILKEWLTRTYGHALDAGMDTFDTDYADKYALDNKGLKTIVEEALIGEAKMQDVSYEEISRLLANGPNFLSRDSHPDSRKSKSVNSRSSRIGTRNPGRDPVGGVQHAG